VRELAREFDVSVITRANNRAVIEAADPSEFVRAPRFIYHDLNRSLRFWKRGNRGAQLYYVLWQQALRARLRELPGIESFDVAHHITFGRYWIPTPLTEVEAPLVFGPVGGADSLPVPFRTTLGFRARRFNVLRETIRGMAETRSTLRNCISHSTIALGTTEATVDALRRLGARDARLEPAVGLPEEEIAAFGKRQFPEQGPVRFVSSGALLAWKGFELGLRAFASVHGALPGSRFSIIGDGPERRNLQLLSRTLGIEGAVTFHGQLPRQDALRTMERSDVLVHPSYHDSGGWVCLEAMAMGLPVVCLDLAGPGVLVAPEAGRRIAATTPQETIRAIADSLLELGSDRELRHALGQAGRVHVGEEYSWNRRGDVLRDICREACE
jgi:glycosyltransferase involved in cell wall biosynthesis